MSQNKKKICYVTSCGGHLTEILEYCQKTTKYQYFFVINQNKDISYLNKKFYVVEHSTFDLKFFLVLYQAYKIFKIPTLFIESFTRVNTLSKTGKIVRFLTKNFYVQTSTLKKKYNFKMLKPYI